MPRPHPIVGTHPGHPPVRFRFQRWTATVGAVPLVASLAFVALVLLGAGCGGSEVSLSTLRCAGDSQDVANPFLLRFELDVDGPAEVLQGGELFLRIDERELDRRPLGPLIVGASRIRFDLILPSSLAVNGRTFTLGVKAYDTFGRPTNEVSMELVVQL